MFEFSSQKTLPKPPPQIASLPLGYNHPSLTAALSSVEARVILANRPALGVLPNKDWPTKLEFVLREMAPRYSVPPKEEWDITTMACGSTANENAFKAAFIKYMDEHREGAPPTQEDLNSSMLNSAPGCPHLSILSFSGGTSPSTVSYSTRATQRAYSPPLFIILTQPPHPRSS